MRHRGFKTQLALLTNARRYSASKADPTRTQSLRRAFVSRVDTGFMRVKGNLLKFVVDEDAFGLRPPNHIARNLYNPGEPRDKHGQWTRGAGAGGIHDTLAGVVARLRAMGAKVEHLEHSSKAYIADKIAYAVSRLPHSLQTIVNSSFHLVRVGTVAAFASWRLGQALAERVSRERGATPEQARRLRGILSTLDITTLKPVSIGLGLSGLGAGLIAAASFIPPASASYLAYSTARNPAATMRAASGMVGDLVHTVRSRFTHNTSEEAVGQLYDVLQAHGFSDWYIALLSAALSHPEVHGLRDAVLVADAAFERQPQDQSTHRKDDAEFLLGEKHKLYLNSFCPTGEGGGVDPTCSPHEDGFELSGTIITGKGKIGIYRDTELVSSDATERVKKWLEIIPQSERLKSAVKRIEVFEDPEHILRRLGQKGIDPEIGETGQVRGAFDFHSGTMYVSTWDGYKHSPHNLFHEFGHSVRGFEETAAEGWAQTYLSLIRNTAVTHNAGAFQFEQDPKKIERFQGWLRLQFKTHITGDDEEALWEAYIQQGYRKGGGRAYDDTTKGRKSGGRQQFLNQTFGNNVTVEKVKLLAGRAFDDLEGITADMSLRMSRVLTDGFVKGLSPEDIGKLLDKELDLGRERADLIARNEIVRVHAEGQLDAFEALGVEEVGAAVEWETAHDLRVCRRCAPLQGVVLKVSEARGLIPRHPRCRCAWLPVTQVDQGDKTTRKEILKAFKASVRAEGGSSLKSTLESTWAGLDVRIDRRRPVSNAARAQLFIKLLNSFCPTGPGGGVDPKCSRFGKHVEHSPVGRVFTSKEDSAHAEAIKALHAEAEYLSVKYPQTAKVLKSLTLTTSKDEYLSEGLREINPFLGVTRASKTTGMAVGDQLAVRTLKAKPTVTEPMLGPKQRVVDASVAGLLRHELAHKIAPPGSEINKAFHKQFLNDNWLQDRRKQVSKRAGSRQPDELLAESFSAYTHRNYKRGTLPKELEAFWDKHLESTTTNTFCPTGLGGGVNPRCGPGGKAASTVPGRKGAGTREDPVRCGSNIKLAARLLAEGKHVRLKQPDQVATLLEKMHKMVHEAIDLGKAAPKFDLCKVSVKNTNLFCQETLGIPRIKMPQMKGAPVPGTLAATKKVSKSGKVDLSREFIEHLRGQGIGVQTTEIRASHLRASQNEIDGVKIAGMVHAAKRGLKDLREQPIFVTRDNYVVDGHHHWAAIVGLGYSKNKDLKVPVHKLDIDIGKALNLANDFANKSGIAPKTVGNYSPNQPRGKGGRWVRGAGSRKMLVGSVGEDLAELRFKGANEHELKRYKELTAERTKLNKKVKAGTATEGEKADAKTVKATLDSIRQTVRDRYAEKHGREAEKKITGKTLTRKTGPRPPKPKPEPQPEPKKVEPIKGIGAAGTPPEGLRHSYDIIDPDRPTYTNLEHRKWFENAMKSYEEKGEAKRLKVLAVVEDISKQTGPLNKKIFELQDKIGYKYGQHGKISPEVQKELDNLRERRQQVFSHLGDHTARAHDVLAAPKDDAIELNLHRTKSSQAVAGEIDKAKEFIEKVMVGGIAEKRAKQIPVGVKSIPGNHQQRSHYDLNNNIVLSQHVNAKTVVHELGHAIEDLNLSIHTAALAFLETRVGNEPLESLRQKFGMNFRNDEKGRGDKFFGEGKDYHAYYVGKDYGARATEVISMGLEKMYLAPVEFARKDPGYFKFMTAVLDGHFR